LDAYLRVLKVVESYLIYLFIVGLLFLWLDKGFMDVVIVKYDVHAPTNTWATIQFMLPAMKTFMRSY
jgi:hypothetical protein